MRNRILAIAAIAGAMAAPIAAQAQSTITTGVVGGSTVVIGEHDGIAADQRPAFREYIVRERVPNYTISERVIVGGVLPETGVTYYDVPQTYGVNALSLHRGERPDRAGRTALASHRSGGRLTQISLNGWSGRRASGCARDTTGHESPARRPLRAGFSLCLSFRDVRQVNFFFFFFYAHPRMRLIRGRLAYSRISSPAFFTTSR